MRRLLGTLLGAVIAFVVIVTLPVWLGALVAAICLVLLAAYSMSGDYFMQTLFLTPMLLIFATLGDENKGITYTGERVFFTIVGVAVGVVALVVLDRWDRAALAGTVSPPTGAAAAAVPLRAVIPSASRPVASGCPVR